MVRLLNQGFPLRAALTIAKGESIVGGQYIVVGDGNADVVQPESCLPYLLSIEGDGPEYDVSIVSYPNGDKGIGTLFKPLVGDADRHYLGSGTQGPFTLSKAQLEAALVEEEIPIQFDGELRWSSDFEL
jgi:hypothetical protein